MKGPLILGVDIAYPQRVAAGGLIKRVSDGKVLADIRDFDFVAIKATQGTSIVDAQWANSYAMARKFGKKVIAYHFNDNSVSVPAQVDFFLKTAKAADAYAIDQEGDKAFTDAQSQAFIDGLHAKAPGHPAIHYHSASGFGGVVSDAQWVADYRLESLQDGDTPVAGWDIWQFSSEGGPDGAGLDLDYMPNDSPLALALGLTYTGKAQADAIHAADLATITQLTADLAAAKDQLAQIKAANAALGEALDAAPGIERERIAQAMGNAMAEQVRNAQ